MGDWEPPLPHKVLAGSMDLISTQSKKAGVGVGGSQVREGFEPLWRGPCHCQKFLLGCEGWGGLLGRVRRGTAVAGRWAGGRVGSLDRGICTNQTLFSSSCSEFHWEQWQQAHLRGNHGQQCSEFLKQWGSCWSQGLFHQDHIYHPQGPPQLSTYNQACGLGECPYPFAHIQEDPSCLMSWSQDGKMV